MGDKERRPRKTFRYEGQKYEATGKTPEEAIANAALMRDKLKRGEIGFSGTMTVKRWSKEWLQTYKKDSSGDRWYKDTQRRIDNLIIPAIGKERLKDVTDIQLQKIINSRAGKSKSEIDKSMDLIKGMFRQARISRLIIHDPSESLRAPQSIEGSHRSITDFERKHILKVAKEHNAGLWVKIMLYCGLRPAETSALSWKDINFKTKRITVVSAMNNETNVLKSTKTRAGVRSIPVPNVLLTELKKIHSETKPDPFDTVLVQTTTGRRHTESSRKRLWGSFLKELDISMGAVFEKRKAKDGKMRLTKTRSVIEQFSPDLTPYCLRHTYCTDLEQAGVPINVAAYLMGHANIHVTSKYYTHTRDQTIEAAADKINEFTKTVGGKTGGRRKSKSA